LRFSNRRFGARRRSVGGIKCERLPRTVPLERDQPYTKISNLSLHAEGRRFRGQCPVVRQLAGLTLDAVQQFPDEHLQQ
jgi:hypothetical protein